MDKDHHTAVQDQKFAAFDMALDLRKPTFWVIFFGGLFSSFATYGTDQTMLQRYLTTSDMKGAKKSLWINIILTVPATLFPLFMASREIKSLWDVFNKVLGLIIGSLGGLFLLGVLFRKARAKGAMIGFVISLLVQVYIATFTHIHLMLYTASGVLSCVLAGWLFSLLLPDSNPKGNPQFKPD